MRNPRGFLLLVVLLCVLCRPLTAAPRPNFLFRCISAVDDCRGRLLDALDELGFATNTVVVYTSDNGFYAGEHGLSDKRSAYDESLRIPFLVRYPALGAAARGRKMDEMVLNLDLATTLLDFAGVPVPKEMLGRSWRPLLTSSATPRTPRSAPGSKPRTSDSSARPAIACPISWTVPIGGANRTARIGSPTANLNDPMQLGADLNSTVVEPAPPRFTGLSEWPQA